MRFTAILALIAVASAQDGTCKSTSDCTALGADFKDYVCADVTVKSTGAAGDSAATVKTCAPKSTCGTTSEVELMGSTISTSVKCGSNIGMIIGVVCGVVVVLGLGGFCYKKSKDTA